MVANLSSAWKSEIITLKVEYSFSTTTTTKNITHSIQKSDWEDRNWKQLDVVALVTDSWTQFLQQVFDYFANNLCQTKLLWQRKKMVVVYQRLVRNDLRANPVHSVWQRKGSNWSHWNSVTMAMTIALLVHVGLSIVYPLDKLCHSNLDTMVWTITLLMFFDFLLREFYLTHGKNFSAILLIRTIFRMNANRK